MGCRCAATCHLPLATGACERKFVPGSFSSYFTLKLTKCCQQMHCASACWGRGVQCLGDADQSGVGAVEQNQQIANVFGTSTQTIETRNNDYIKLARLQVLHELSKSRAI